MGVQATKWVATLVKSEIWVFVIKCPVKGVVKSRTPKMNWWKVWTICTFQQNKQKIFFWTLQAVTLYNCYLNGDAEGIFTPSSIPKQAHFSVFKFPILINSIYCS